MLVLSVGVMALTDYPGLGLPWGEISSDVPPGLAKEIEGLRSLDAADRAQAAIRIGEMGKEGAPAVPFLLMILGDSTPLQSGRNPQEPTSPGQEAALALVNVGTLAVDPLVGALHYEDPTVRKHAAWALGKIRDPRAIRPLIETLKDDDPRVRSHAAMALAEITGEDHGDDPVLWQNWLDEWKLRHCLFLKTFIEILRSSPHR